MSSHLDWCRQRILSVKPEDPATAGIPAQEVCDVIYSMCRVCVCVCRVCVCVCVFYISADFEGGWMKFSKFLC